MLTTKKVLGCKSNPGFFLFNEGILVATLKKNGNQLNSFISPPSISASSSPSLNLSILTFLFFSTAPPPWAPPTPAPRPGLGDRDRLFVTEIALFWIRLELSMFGAIMELCGAWPEEESGLVITRSCLPPPDPEIYMRYDRDVRGGQGGVT